jgi:hypothetical protein
LPGLVVERPRTWKNGVGYKVLFEGDDGARVDRRDDNRTATNLLIGFQAEHTLSGRTRAIINFNRVKTFRATNDRDLFQVGLLRRF